MKKVGDDIDQGSHLMRQVLGLSERDGRGRINLPLYLVERIRRMHRTPKASTNKTNAAAPPIAPPIIALRFRDVYEDRAPVDGWAVEKITAVADSETEETTSLLVCELGNRVTGGPN